MNVDCSDEYSEAFSDVNIHSQRNGRVGYVVTIHPTHGNDTKSHFTNTT